MTSSRGVEHPILHPFLFLYQLLQWLISQTLTPSPPRSQSELGRPKIAIIGAGITGVTAASHCVGHGFDVAIFEGGPREQLGGIWSRVNDTSGLQIHSLMYRFHPSVTWSKGYPDRKQIIEQVTLLWERYGLESKTKFDFRVEKTHKDNDGRWIINDDPSLGRFEGLVAAVGTCGDAKKPHIPGMEDFKGEVYHSSELTSKQVDAKGKKVIIIGGGASAVEALEYTFANSAFKTTILSRSEKWIIPRNIIADTLLSFNILGQETRLSSIPEFLLRKLFYGRDLLEASPPTDTGLFTDTPMVNSDIMTKLRSGDAEWVRGDIDHVSEEGVLVNKRSRGVPKNGPGRHITLPADIIILATGFKRPPLSFLPSSSFAEPYAPPNWYLQTFPPQHPSLCAINCTYVSAIGTVGNWHIGIYTRILLMFLLDPLARPGEVWMRRWIDMTRWLKRTSPTGAFDFFTYLELVWWFVFCVVVNPFRWKWAVFVFLGVGVGLPRRVVEGERRLIKEERLGVVNGNGYEYRDEGRSL